MYWGGVRYRAIVSGSAIVFGCQVQRFSGVTTGKHQESMSTLVGVEDEQDGEEMELCVWVVEPKITDNGGNGEHRCVSEAPGLNKVGGSNPGSLTSDEQAAMGRRSESSLFSWYTILAEVQ